MWVLPALHEKSQHPLPAHEEVQLVPPSCQWDLQEGRHLCIRGEEVADVALLCCFVFKFCCCCFKLEITRWEWSLSKTTKELLKTPTTSRWHNKKGKVTQSIFCIQALKNYFNSRCASYRRILSNMSLKHTKAGTVNRPANAFTYPVKQYSSHYCDIVKRLLRNTQYVV